MKAIISDILAAARSRLKAVSFEPDTREANLLLADVLGWTEAQVIARHDQALDGDQVARFELALNRRLTGEPVAYIVGSREFFGRRFQVDDRALIPRPETEHLVEAVLELPLPKGSSILDLGTGSGCLACTFALELPASRLVACDISLGALTVARRNLELHGLSARVQLLTGDLAQCLDLNRFDLVVSNPPYVGVDEADSLSSEIIDFEPHTALFAGGGGLAVHRRLLHELAELRPGSWLVLEIGARQAGALRTLIADSCFELREFRTDYAGHIRIMVLRRR